MEDRKRPVRIVVHPDTRLDEVGAQRARRDLEREVPVAHAVVVADHPLFLNAQHLAVNAGVIGDERRAGMLGRDREAGVVLGEIDLAQIAVSRC